MKTNPKLEKILEKSKKVLEDVALPNGAIVAANTDHEYYPRTAKDYRYVWPRDAAYVCIALDYLERYANGRECECESTRKFDAKHPPYPPQRGSLVERYFDWFEKYPEDFKKEGLLFQNYSTNGRKAGEQFQPDQMGVSLFAIWHHFNDDLRKAYKYETLIRRLADGIYKEWQGSCFFKNACDLWEEDTRKTSTKLENNFTYSLAACACGLEKANLMFPDNDYWEKTAKEMRAKIDEAYNKKDKYFVRCHGRLDDKNVDGSLLGLVWPFEIIGAYDERIKNTVKKIEEKIVINGGAHRFEMDYYDGEGTAQEGAGAWPLLNFWMAIYWALVGDKKKAEKCFNWVVEKIGDDFLIPEQIYDDFRDGKGIKPLAWSHAMFVISYYRLKNTSAR